MSDSRHRVDGYENSPAVTGALSLPTGCLEFILSSESAMLDVAGSFLHLVMHSSMR